MKFNYNLYIMKSAFAFLTIFVFIGSAVFGFFAMNHMDGHEFSACGAAKAQGAASCFEALKNFSVIILDQNLLKIIFAASLLAFLAVVNIIIADFRLVLPEFYFWKWIFFKLFPFFFKKRILRRLALYENSPPYHFF